MGQGIDELLKKNVVASANADGSLKKSETDKEAERDALHTGLRKYSTAIVQAPDEAMEVLKRAPKQGGKNFGDPTALKPTVSSAEETYAQRTAAQRYKQASATPQASLVNFDPFSGGNAVESCMESPTPYVPQGTHTQYVDRIIEKVVEVPRLSATDTYLASRRRISIKTTDGTFMLSVVDVKHSSESLVVLLPVKDDSITFIPNRGTEMTVTWREDGRDKTERVYFPGTVAEIGELGLIVLSMIVIGKE